MNEHHVTGQPVVQNPPPPAYVAPAGVVVPTAVIPPQEVQCEPEAPPVPVKLIHFTAFPNFVVVWPIIVLGLLFSMLHATMGDHYPERVASTLWMMSLFLMMMALGFDFDSTETAFIVITFVAILMLLQLVAFEWQLPVFAWIEAHLRMLEVRVSANMMFVVSILLGVPYLLMLIFCRMNNYWTAVPGKLIRKTFGKNEEEIPINSTKTVNYHFYDMVMRWLCFGAGHLIVATDKGEKKIGYVLWAKKRDRDIEPFETMPVSAPVKRE